MTGPNFNPRAHEGHDHQLWDRICNTKQFQSTCPRGARHGPLMQMSCCSSAFQSTCPRGARPGARCADEQSSISIHVPTRGTTCWPNTLRTGSKYFNPRAHEGHDGRLSLSRHSPAYFNPRAHEGHDTTTYRITPCSDISIHVPTRGTTTGALRPTA